MVSIQRIAVKGLISLSYERMLEGTQHALSAKDKVVLKQLSFLVCHYMEYTNVYVIYEVQEKNEGWSIYMLRGHPQITSPKRGEGGAFLQKVARGRYPVLKRGDVTPIMITFIFKIYIARLYILGWVTEAFSMEVRLILWRFSNIDCH